MINVPRAGAQQPWQPEHVAWSTFTIDSSVAMPIAGGYCINQVEVSNGSQREDYSVHDFTTMVSFATSVMTSVVRI